VPNSKKTPAEVNVAYATELKAQAARGLVVALAVDMDEFWSSVGKKSEQRWTWYAMEHDTGIILAHHNGRRTDAACQALLDKLACFPIRRYYTDHWQSYSKLLPYKQHRIGKDKTWRIERKNVNFRTDLARLHRKTLNFSKDPTIHDNVIGLYLERHYYHKNYHTMYI
jgi:insertion element IS1 protein InsB